MKYSILLIIGILVAGSIGGLAVIAQPANTERFFQKDFCADEIDLLGGINYSNGDELSYDSGGCPISTKVIHRWNELNVSQQNIITNQLSLRGYTDVTSEVLQ